jgi:hypothetical protein
MYVLLSVCVLSTNVFQCAVNIQTFDFGSVLYLLSFREFIDKIECLTWTIYSVLPHIIKGLNMYLDVAYLNKYGVVLKKF